MVVSEVVRHGASTPGRRAGSLPAGLFSRRRRSSSRWRLSSLSRDDPSRDDCE